MKHHLSEHKLTSGAQLLLVDVPGSEVVSFEVRFASGYVFGRPDKYEIPHVMEHVMATQSQKYPAPNQFMIEAGKNGAYVNASTSARSNGYVYECAAFELDRMLDLLEEQLVRPLFTAERVKVEIENVREELTRNTTNHGGVCALGLSAAVLPAYWQTYDQRLSQLNEIGVADVTAHYNATYTAANARVVIAGDVSGRRNEFVARFERIFQGLAVGERLVAPPPHLMPLAHAWQQERPIEQLYYRVVWLGAALDDAARYELAVLRGLLVGSMGSRILGKARERGLAYHVGALTWDDLGVGGFGLAGNVSMPHARALFELMHEQLAAVASGNVTAEELSATQQMMVGGVLRSVQTVGDLLGWYLEQYDSRLTYRPLESELQAISAVTVEQVGERARQVLALTPAWGMVGPVNASQAQSLSSGLFSV